jgi:DNA-binding IclR family transcriptional regulator
MAERQQREKGSTVRRAFAVLEELAAADRPVTPTELNAGLDLPKASLHRICRLLIEEGLLQHEFDGHRLIPGPRLSRLCFGVLATRHMSAERRAVLQGISSEIGETCNIALPNGSKMIYFDRVETHWPLRHQLPVGTQVPLYCTASGKLFLASLPGARRRRLVERLTMERCTPNTITEAARLHEALKRIRREEVGTDDEEFLEGMVAVSVPIRDARGRAAARIGKSPESFTASALRPPGDNRGRGPRPPPDRSPGRRGR